MAIDLSALRAKLAAQKAEQAAASTQGVSNASTTSPANTTVAAGNATPLSTAQESQAVPVVNESVAPTISAPAVLGTSKTTEIDHLDFLAKMNSLAAAIHTQHPTMPVLLMQIHKQLRTDPELVTTLDDAAIGVIVKGLQIQTKTELVAEAVKKASSGRTKKNANLDVSLF